MVPPCISPNARGTMPAKTTPENHIPPVHYDAKKGCYWLGLSPNRWLALEKRDVKNHFQLAGFPCEEFHTSGLKAFDHAMVLCQRDLYVDYAGPLAGHRAGLLKTQDGKRVLVTSESSPVAAKVGDCPNFDRFIAELLPEQSQYFLYWLKIARESLLEGSFRSGQMVALAGPSGCGKSLLQSLITAFLGGRMAKPYLYMVEKTAFNSHLAASEHLVIADEQASLDLRSRRNFGSKIKEMCVNREMSIHAKGRDISVTVDTFRRITLSVNDEPENLAILPPMDESILDKIILLKCSRAEVGDNPKEIWKRFESELPQLAYQLELLRIPKALKDSRYGVKAYHNPELLEIVADISPETRLLQLIDQIIFTRRNGEDHKHFKDRTDEPWRGTAVELEKDLRQSDFAFAIDKLLSFSGACGTYLSRLKSKFPERFQHSKNRGKTIWQIQKPE